MIKSFRKIRQKLMAENKTTLYLKYAIGEIVLVVIGILIFLAINIHFQYKQERKVETSILKKFPYDIGHYSLTLTNLIQR